MNTGPLTLIAWPVTVTLPLLENEERGQHDEEKSHRVVPLDIVPQIENGENREDHQRDDFLDGFQLRRIETVAADAVSRDLKAILKKSDAPAYQRDLPQRHILIFQMPVPGKGHKYV
jgi:hypothetical protein